MLRDGALSIVSYTVYWTVGFSLYASSYNGGATPHQLRMDPVFKLYCYVLAGRGIVTYVGCLDHALVMLACRGRYFLWFVINSPQLITTKWLDFSEDGIDTNISAQLNTSLQSDLLEYTVRGMLRAIYESDEIVAAAATEDANGQRPAPRLSIDSATSMSSMRLTVVDTMPQTKARVQKKGVKTPLPPAKRSVHFVNYRPSTFASLRSHFQLKTDDFVASFEEATKPSISEGASGAFMFFSKDMRFIVKSMVEAEAWFLVKIAPDYRNYMLSQPHTKLTRFFGCFKITLHGNKFYFVVMENLFANAPEIHHRYDIKGSWDDDIHYRLRLGAAEGNHLREIESVDLRWSCLGRALLDQLKRDSVFLRDQGIMDYSLLIGVVDVQYKVDKSDAGVENPHLCDSISGPGLYYVGVIDILQTWNFQKRMERWAKIWLRGKDPRGLSAIEPYPYQVRFEAKLRDLIATDEYSSNALSTNCATKHLQPLFAHNRSLEPVSFSSRPTPQLIKTWSTPQRAGPARMASTEDPSVWL
ncbi:hypothetical protein DYB32_008409 [Aphanomyces invadans]|uniref:PIPK domain-containing protein n=1 Tax=Aphanomyces invadans TaxID=157072 RepID=A0A418AL76_9STRA|nr:hypothetical protein DYB32_008409 [Aphanomyces invadans]